MKQIKPGYFGQTIAADSRRGEFDIKNESILVNHTPVDYLFFGDSITHFWELAAYFSIPGQRIINRGIGGDTTTYASKRFAADVLQLNPRLCICMIGVNDGWELEYDPWNRKEGKSVSEVLQRAVENYREMLSSAREKGIRMAVCSILPVNMDFTNSDDKRKEYILQMNEQLKKLSAEYGCIYVDYHAHVVRQDGRTIVDGITFEGLHPNAKGYQLMAEVLRDTLKGYGYQI